VRPGVIHFDVLYEVQISSDLTAASWAPSGIVPEITDNLDGTETVRYTGFEGLFPDAGRGFIQLVVKYRP